MGESKNDRAVEMYEAILRKYPGAGPELDALFKVLAPEIAEATKETRTKLDAVMLKSLFELHHQKIKTLLQVMLEVLGPLAREPEYIQQAKGPGEVDIIECPFASGKVKISFPIGGQPAIEMPWNTMYVDIVLAKWRRLILGQM